MIIAVWVSQEEHQQRRATGSTLLVAKTSEEPATLKSLKVPPAVVYDQHSQPYPVASRLTEYLQAHNSSRYIDGTVSLQPYARVVSYSQE